MPDTSAAHLTDQQTRVLEQVARGLTDRQIAQALGVSESTVQRRIQEASQALGARSRTDLAVRALTRRLIAVPEEWDR